MAKVKIESENFLSVTEANRRGISKLVSEAQGGSEFVIGRNSVPAAAIIGIERLSDIQRLEEDLSDLVLATARVLTDEGRRTSLDEVLSMFELTRSDLDKIES
ncbi:MAG: prevent-host-death family protein [Actinomycetota bacterium]